MEVAEAHALISAAWRANRLAPGYLLCGDVSGNCQELVDLVLADLFPDAREQVARHQHPDVIYLEPEGKLRIIKTESMRDKLIVPMATTSFSGGWKVGVIVGIDHIHPNAANAFLKTLEEPTPHTVFFMLTDAPELVMATILSRSQRLDLGRPNECLTGAVYAQVKALFEAGLSGNTAKRSDAAQGLAAILADLKKAAEADDREAEVPLVRKQFYKTLIGFAREGLVRSTLPLWQAGHNIEVIEEAYYRSSNSMPEELILVDLMDRLYRP